MVTSLADVVRVSEEMTGAALATPPPVPPPPPSPVSTVGDDVGLVDGLDVG
jgi:hypothetical protein